MTTTWMECFPFSLTATTIQFTGTQTVTLFGELHGTGWEKVRKTLQS